MFDKEKKKKGEEDGMKIENEDEGHQIRAIWVLKNRAKLMLEMESVVTDDHTPTLKLDFE